MNHAADVGIGEKIHDVVMAGLDVHFDFGETGDVGMRDCRRADKCRAPRRADLDLRVLRWKFSSLYLDRPEISWPS